MIKVKSQAFEMTSIGIFFFLFGLTVAFIFPKEGFGVRVPSRQNTILAAAKQNALAQFSNCKGTLIYVDEFGEQVIFRHGRVPEAAEETGGHF